MAKVKDLKLGQTLWMAYDSKGRVTVKDEPMEVQVTGLIVKRGSHFFRVSHNESQYPDYWENELKRFFFFTKEKAQRFMDNVHEEQKRRFRRDADRREIWNRNTDALVTVQPLVGARIMIKVEDGEWVTSSIKEVIPTYRKDQLGFIDAYRSNHYRFTREGINWKYWTELDELKIKQEAIAKRIAELEALK